MIDDRQSMLDRLYRDCTDRPDLTRMIDNLVHHPPEDMDTGNLMQMLGKHGRPWLERWAARFGADPHTIADMQERSAIMADNHRLMDDASYGMGDFCCMMHWIGAYRPRTKYPQLYATKGPDSRVGVLECVKSWSAHYSVPMDWLYEICASLWRMEPLDFSKLDHNWISLCKRQTRRQARTGGDL